MKIAKFFSAVFGLLGTVVLVASMGLCLSSLNRETRVVEVPEGAMTCAESFVLAVDTGDLSGAGRMMYGQPDLGMDGEPAEKSGRIIWKAFLDSISCELTGEYYLDGAVICRTGTVTALDIPSATQNLQPRFRALLTERMEQAEDMTELYDENNDFRADLLEELMAEAVSQALQEDAQTSTREITLEMIRRDGQWWVVPDQALLATLGGGLS